MSLLPGPVQRYIAADNPRARQANLIAMVLAWNTPFYPLYLWWSAGNSVFPGAWLTLIVFPLFLAMPALIRRHDLGGRIGLALASLANTVFDTWVLGEAAGTTLFLLPCVTLAALIFRASEKTTFYTMLALPVAAGFALHGRYPASPFVCQAETCASILWLNAGSVACVTMFFAILAATAPSDPGSTPDPMTLAQTKSQGVIRPGEHS